MSKGNSAIKVLRTALKRVNKGWTKGDWVTREDGVVRVCLEGAIYGYCQFDENKVTDAQREAIRAVEDVILEKTGATRNDNVRGAIIPRFNDRRGEDETTLEDIQEVIKLGIIRLETGAYDDELDEAEIDDLVDFMNSKE